MANVHLLDFRGDLDISRVPEIEQELARIEAIGEQAVAILDLSEVAYVDTAFFNAVFRLRQHLADNGDGGRICIVAGERTSRLMKMVGLNEMVSIFSDLQHARQFAEGPAFA